MNYSHIPRGYAQVSSEMPFFLIKAIELQKFMFRRKYLTFINNWDKIFFQKKKQYQKVYKKNENLLFSKFQH